MKKYVVSLALALLCLPAMAQVKVVPLGDHATLLKSSDARLAQNKKIAYDFWREVIEAGHVELAEKYMTENYIQHNPMIPTGRKAKGGYLPFRRSRRSLPVLKNGTFLSSTFTASPVRGLRPTRASRALTEKAPKPRSSTRSPLAKASMISSKTVLTIRST